MVPKSVKNQRLPHRRTTMKKLSFPHVLIIVAVSLILIILLCIAVFFLIENFAKPFYEPYQITVEGFSDELVTQLSRDYGVTIPSDAVFVEGEITGSVQEPQLVITFKLPVSEDYDNTSELGAHIQGRLLNENWGLMTQVTDTSVSEADAFIGQFIYGEKAFTHLFISDMEDGAVLVRFSGWRPAYPFG